MSLMLKPHTQPHEFLGCKQTYTHTHTHTFNCTLRLSLCVFKPHLQHLRSLCYFFSQCEIPGGHLRRHSQQILITCTSMMFILLIRNQSRLCAKQGLDSQAAERSLWAQRSVCKLWLNHSHKDFKTAGKLHPKLSHSDAVRHPSRAEREGFKMWKLLIKEKQAISSWNAAVGTLFLSVVHLLCTVKKAGHMEWGILIVLIMCLLNWHRHVDMETPPFAQLFLCSNGSVLKNKRLMLCSCHVGITEEITSW